MYCGTSMCHHLPTLFGRVMTGKLTFTDPTSSFGWLDLGWVEVVQSLAAAREFLTLHGDPSSLFPCSTAQGIQYERQASQTALVRHIGDPPPTAYLRFFNPELRVPLWSPYWTTLLPHSPLLQNMGRNGLLAEKSLATRPFGDLCIRHSS
ncbi:hypothetical protein EDD15DRAFT_2203336 [Pisolithus albus]|nr:hypothetical protein EDD15DRAFT_2203336 [Pisolithus albus]